MKRALRPSEIFIRDEILRRLSSGESLRAICRDEGFPAEATVRLWSRDDDTDDDFPARYTRAREEGYACMAEELLAIADEAELTGNYEGETVTIELSSTAVQRNKLRVDARKWMLSKMLPKTFGDKVAHEVGGVDGKPIQTENLNVTVPADPVAASQLYLKIMEGRG